MAAEIVQQFDFQSFQHLLDHTVNADSPLAEAKRASRTKEKTDWYGTDSFETTHQLAMYGWPEGLKKIRVLAKDVIPKFHELFPRQEATEEIVHDVAGNYEDPIISDIGIDPQDMVRFVSRFDKIKMGSTLQRLIIETSASAFISPETMFLRGACVIAMLECLETYGFRVEVILQTTQNTSSIGGDTGRLVVIRTKIKDFEDHSDYDKFAFCLANSSLYRRLMFSVMESCREEVVKEFGFYSDSCYAYPHNHPLYIDPARDFYMVRPLHNETFIQCVTKTAQLIKDRYTNMVQDVYNPDLSGRDDGGGGFWGK